MITFLKLEHAITYTVVANFGTKMNVAKLILQSGKFPDNSRLDSLMVQGFPGLRIGSRTLTTTNTPSILHLTHINHNHVKFYSSDQTPLTAAQKLKKAVAEYGSTVIVFHIGISLVSLGSCYLLVSTGLDVQQLLVTLKLDDWVKGNTMLVNNAGTFAVAYAIHKVFAPVRMGITLGSVPFIVRYLRQKGILKK